MWGSRITFFPVALETIHDKFISLAYGYLTFLPDQMVVAKVGVIVNTRRNDSCAMQAFLAKES